MAQVIESAYESLAKANLKAGFPNEVVLIEGGGEKGLYSIGYIKGQRNLPPDITLAGFDFKNDENASLLIFPEKKKYDADGFLVQDFEKIEAVMSEIFRKEESVPKLSSSVETPKRERKRKIVKGPTCGSCTSYKAFKCSNVSYNKDYPDGMDVDPDEMACSLYSPKS